MVRLTLSAILLTFCLLASARADTVFLEDGTKIEGRIIRESDTEVEMEVPLPSGKSFSTKFIAKKTISRIKKTTAEEIAFAQLKGYQTLPGSSLTLAQYDQILATLNKFVTDFPGSTSAVEVQRWMAAWQQDREQVNRGLVKISHPKLLATLWMPQVEAKPFLAWQTAYLDMQKKSAALQNIQAQVSAEQAKRDKFASTSGLIQPGIRDAELKKFDSRLNVLKPQAEQADKLYKAALELFQKIPDPGTAYLDAQNAALAETTKLMGASKPRHSTLVAVQTTGKKTPAAAVTKPEEKPALPPGTAAPTPPLLKPKPNPTPAPAAAPIATGGKIRLITKIIILILAIVAAAVVKVLKDKKSAPAKAKINLTVKLETKPPTKRSVYPSPDAAPPAAPPPADVGFPVFIKKVGESKNPPSAPTADRPTLSLND